MQIIWITSVIKERNDMFIPKSYQSDSRPDHMRHPPRPPSPNGHTQWCANAVTSASVLHTHCSGANNPTPSAHQPLSCDQWVSGYKYTDNSHICVVNTLFIMLGIYRIRWTSRNRMNKSANSKHIACLHRYLTLTLNIYGVIFQIL